MGHGMRTAATMGRLRTTVAPLAALDLAPEELLAHLDDLVAQAGSALPPESGDEDHALGVTCLYAIYDPISRPRTTPPAKTATTVSSRRGGKHIEDDIASAVKPELVLDPAS
ncbi:SpoIIE family protein phosphatase [Streptomyces heilongjiangensis]|uniref:SpoIIE family protein phosphatase n=1 Tax=Streptomyces heilongjiangensis TaxID=945052 RepID=A0ABW1BKU4_9ACTN